MIHKLILPGVTALILLKLSACTEPDAKVGEPAGGPDPLDSLLGYYDGTVERSQCKQPNLPSAGQCGLVQDTTLPAYSSNLSRLENDSITLFLPGFASLSVRPGDTVFADTADAVGTVSCFLIPDQTVSPSGSPQLGATYEHVEGGPICRDSTGALPAFTLRVKNDPNLLIGNRQRWRLHRVSNPSP